MPFTFANNVNTTLAGAITSAGQTSIVLASSANLPTLSGGNVMPLVLTDQATRSKFEIVYVTAISGATLTVIRGQEGTAALTWLIGDYAYAAETAGVLTDKASLSQTAIQTFSGPLFFSVATGTTIGSEVLIWRSATAYSNLGSASGVTVQGITGSLAVFGYSNTPGGTNHNEVTFDTVGNIGINGAFCAGTFVSSQPNGTAAYVPVVTDLSGSTLASTTHICRGTVTATFTASQTSAAATVTLSGAAAFSNANYTVALTVSNSSGLSGFPYMPTIASKTGTGFTITAYQSAVSTGTITFDMTITGD